MFSARLDVNCHYFFCINNILSDPPKLFLAIYGLFHYYCIIIKFRNIWKLVLWSTFYLKLFLYLYLYWNQSLTVFLFSLCNKIIQISSPVFLKVIVFRPSIVLLIHSFASPKWTDVKWHKLKIMKVVCVSYFPWTSHSYIMSLLL